MDIQAHMKRSVVSIPVFLLHDFYDVKGKGIFTKDYWLR